MEENKQIWYDNFNEILGIEDLDKAEKLAEEDPTYQSFDCNFTEDVKELTVNET